jgi:hypothetical protein
MTSAPVPQNWVSTDCSRLMIFGNRQVGFAALVVCAPVNEARACKDTIHLARCGAEKPIAALCDYTVKAALPRRANALLTRSAKAQMAAMLEEFANSARCVGYRASCSRAAAPEHQGERVKRLGLATPRDNAQQYNTPESKSVPSSVHEQSRLLRLAFAFCCQCSPCERLLRLIHKRTAVWVLHVNSGLREESACAMQGSPRS